MSGQIEVGRGDDLARERHGLTQFAGLQRVAGRFNGPTARTEPGVAGAHLGCQPKAALIKTVAGPAA